MSERSLFRRRASLSASLPPPATTNFSSPACGRRPDVARDAVEILRSELLQLRLTELIMRADSAGVHADTLDAAAESDHPKENVVALIVAKLVPNVDDLLTNALAGGRWPDDVREARSGTEEEDRAEYGRARLAEVRVCGHSFCYFCL
jgi:hypothetical protein